jgi:hypothetical protein
MRSTSSAFLLIGCLFMAGCTGAVEPTDLSALEIGASRDQVEAALGQPVKVRSEDEMQVATYGYNRGRGATPTSGNEVLGRKLGNKKIKNYNND